MQIIVCCFYKEMDDGQKKLGWGNCAERHYGYWFSRCAYGLWLIAAGSNGNTRANRNFHGDADINADSYLGAYCDTDTFLHRHASTISYAHADTQITASNGCASRTATS
ncbi:MAG: hypothetical protein AB8I69_16280 [Anaerolineae bacterium]